MFSISDYKYDLPEKLIAQKPVEKRDDSRLLVLERKTGRIEHKNFYDICDFFSPLDVLVINNTRVIPGRLLGKKSTGGKVEVLILDYADAVVKNKNNGEFLCRCLVKSSKHSRPEACFYFDNGLQAKVLEDLGDGIYYLKFLFKGNFEKHLYKTGAMPLPPYIKRGVEYTDGCKDNISYQTVYASQKGAVAAPTAGLHFTEKLLKKIESKGVLIASITLHVGYGTFLPVRTEDIREHQIHTENYYISEKDSEIINKAAARGGRVISVGTTSVRTLEFSSDSSGHVAAGRGDCNLFIYPNYRFKTVNAMITNFHLPQSTLIMLVSAFAGREKILEAYEEAIKERYRFYSYGDAMLII